MRRDGALRDPGPDVPPPPPTSTIATQLVWVFVAGGTGAALRVLLATWVDHRWSSTLPYAGTLVVNMLGCFAIGVAAVALPGGPVRTAIVGGLLGGFTTYSAFALFSHELLTGGRHAVLALQVGLHLAVGIGCVAAGIGVARLVVGNSEP